MHSFFLIFIVLKGFSFVAHLNIKAKAFCIAFFLKPSLSLWMSLSLLISWAGMCIHTMACPLPTGDWFLKALILSFSYCNTFSSLVIFICKKKRKFFTESYIPQCRGSLNLSRSNCCCQYARTYFFINFSKALIILRRLIPGPIMPSNSRYLQSFFVWDLKALDSIKSSFPCLSQKHLWT